MPSVNSMEVWINCCGLNLRHGPLTRYVNCRLRVRRECRERFPRHRLQSKPLVIDPGMHHGTCVTHVPWCMSGSITRGGGENVPSIPGACTTRNFAYLVRGPWLSNYISQQTFGWDYLSMPQSQRSDGGRWCNICHELWLIMCTKIQYWLNLMQPNKHISLYIFYFRLISTCFTWSLVGWHMSTNRRVSARKT